MFFANLLMVVGFCAAFIGGGYYLIEHVRGKVAMHTKLNELSSKQLVAFFCAIFGLAFFFGGLIGSVILRS